jgi:shikimate kinase
MAEEHSRGVAIGGFMGTGKSTIGPLLAQRLGLSFVDLDRSIEAAENCTVASIFERAGEAEFRRREAACLDSLSHSPPVVLALGGGTLHQPGWRDRLAGFRIVVLHASWSVVHERISTDRGARPLASHAEELFVSRAAGYRSAGIEILVDDRTPEEVCEAILNVLEEGA